jgi:hypothetical protein
MKAVISTAAFSRFMVELTVLRYNHAQAETVFIYIGGILDFLCAQCFTRNHPFPSVSVRN